jgi:hypothetical protein
MHLIGLHQRGGRELPHGGQLHLVVRHAVAGDPPVDSTAGGPTQCVRVESGGADCGDEPDRQADPRA